MTLGAPPYLHLSVSHLPFPVLSSLIEDLLGPSGTVCPRPGVFNLFLLFHPQMAGCGAVCPWPLAGGWRTAGRRARLGRGMGGGQMRSNGSHCVQASLTPTSGQVLLWGGGSLHAVAAHMYPLQPAQVPLGIPAG